MNDLTIESLERATLDAVAPPEVQEIDGWLLPFDHSTIGRAKSAVPTRHHALNPHDIARIHTLYTQRAMETVIRAADVPGLASIHSALRAQGLCPTQPVLVQIGSVAGMRSVCNGAPAEISLQPTSAWASVYTALGFDPVDGANRVKALSRSNTVIYAYVQEDGQTVAAGTASFSQGWCSIHGMRTLASHRGQGLAGRILAGLADAAARQGLERAFLQVESDNAPAQALYQRAGFESAWTYHYWRSI